MIMQIYFINILVNFKLLILLNWNLVMSKNILVTGSAGFIGFHLCKKLIENGFYTIGFDNVNNYYDTKLKNKRIEILEHTAFK